MITLTAYRHWSYTVSESVKIFKITHEKMNKPFKCLCFTKQGLKNEANMEKPQTAVPPMSTWGELQKPRDFHPKVSNLTAEINITLYKKCFG